MAFDDPPDDRRASDKRRAEHRDRDDYNREVAGIDGRHIARFFTGVASRINHIKEKREAERIWRTLAELMLNPAYRARYEAFGSFLDDSRSWAEDTKSRINAALEQANSAIEGMLDAAPRLPDGGPRVFRFADGRVIDEHGNPVGPEIAAGIVWPENAPSAEAYLAALDHRDALEQAMTDLEAFQIEVLGPAQNRYEDEEHGITIDEMDQFEGDIRGEMQAIEAIVTAHAPHYALESPKPSSADIDTALPDIGRVDKPNF